MKNINIELFSPEQKAAGSSPAGRTKSFVINAFPVLDALA